MSVDAHAYKFGKALQRYSRVLLKGGSRALREARRAANKAAASVPPTSHIDASATRTEAPGPTQVSKWKTAMLAGLSAMFVISLAYALIQSAITSSARSSSASIARTTPPRTAATLANETRSDAIADATHSAIAQPPHAEVTEAACYAKLNDAGVGFQMVSKSDAPGVAWPIKLTSAVDGVLVHGGKQDAATNYLDCRLAVALLAWAPSLREEGVVGLEHYSAYRRDAVVAGTSSPSGHAIGSAIDIGRFEMRDGRKLSVLDDWTNRDRGADPCQEWPTDSDAARIMRKLVCDAYHAELFQSVITPHYNDAHKNHVHLEIAPKSEGAWIG